MRFYSIPLLLLFSLSCLERLAAQACGCVDSGNCPTIASANTQTTVCYELTDVFLDDLSDPNQGVCGVNVHFRHGNIAQQGLTLCSPDGTCIELTGLAGECDVFTPLAQWDILFVPCDSMPHPDTINGVDYPFTWDNCPDDAWGNALYSGSYYPFLGCLEDFNTGTANGEWCLTMDNVSMFNSGQILDFEIIFCDDSGILCCEADAGSLSLIPDINSCEGDSSLILDISPDYGAVEPDPAEYGYTYVISFNGEIIDYQDTVNLIDQMPGTYEVCGLSYQLSEEASLPAPNTGFSSNDLRDNLEGPTPLFCGHLSSSCFSVNIFLPIPPVDLQEVICQGDCFMVGDSCYSEAGQYSTLLIASNNCDSLVNLDLTVLEIDTTFLNETICLGASFSVGDSMYFETGVFETTLGAASTCDSLVVLDLTVLDPVEINLVETICEGDSILIGNSVYTQAGVYSDTLMSMLFQCDSIVNLELSIASLDADIAVPDMLSCLNDTITLDGTGSIGGAFLDYNWSSLDGHFAGDQNLSMVQVDSAGTYVLTISDGACENIDSVIVSADFETPTAIGTSSNNINCNQVSSTLDATNSIPSAGNALSYFWGSSGMCVASSPNSPITPVSCAGDFSLIVVNSQNGCADTSLVSVLEDVTQPNANAGNDIILTCENPCLELDGSSSQPVNELTFFWTTSDGNIKSGITSDSPEVDDNGLYMLIIQDQNNFCRDTDFVSVSFDTIAPILALDVSEPDTLTCLDTLVTLTGMELNNISNVNFQWLGNIASGQGTSIATVTESGNYSLVVTNNDNGCNDSLGVFINEDIILPIAVASEDSGLILNCAAPAFQIGSSMTSQGPEYIYNWTTDSGNFISSTNDFQVLIDSAGTYYLEVINQITGCVAVDSVFVDSNYTAPVAQIIGGGEIDCMNESLVLNANLGSEPWLFIWRILDGPVIAQGVDLNSITIDFEAMIELEVIDNQFFCSSLDTAEVIFTDDIPNVNAGSDIELDCSTGEAEIDASSTNISGDLIFSWLAPSNCIVGGEETLNPVVNCPGMYILEVMDTVSSCVAYDTVFALIDTIACTPFVYAGADTLLNCYTLAEVVLEADGPVEGSGPYDYEWTHCDGSPVDAGSLQQGVFNPLFGEGCYIFTITNTVFDLSVSDTVILIGDFEDPIADAGVDLLLTCSELDSCITIDAGNSSQGTDYTYLWTTINGNFCTDPTNLDVGVNGEGIYELTVLDTTNGCEDNDVLFINRLGESPVANAGNNIQLECGINIDTLDGSNSFVPGQTEICWFTNTGAILEGKNSLSPVVSGSGVNDTFYLVLTNPMNECIDTSFAILLAETGCFPDCQILFPETLNCLQDTICLEAAPISIEDNHCYLWTNLLNGNIVSPDTLSKINIDAAGFYQLDVTRKINGSQFTTSCQVEVMEDFTPPEADAGPNQFITCVDTCLTLDGSNSAANALYQWTTIGGNIKSGDQSLEPQVDAIGSYELTVTSLQNGCTASDLVEVGTNFDTPVVDAGPPNELSCVASQVALNGTSIPSANDEVSISWYTDDGNINPLTINTLSPIVSAAGTYCLVVTDLDSGCTAEDCTTVTESNDLPDCSVAETHLFLTCENSSVFLEGATNDQSNLHAWSSTDCPVTGGQAGQFIIEVSCPGVYTFTVTNFNGCSSNHDVLVEMDNLPPLANAGEDVELNCENPTVQLDGGNSQSQSIQPNAGSLTYNWSTIGGQFDTTTDIPTPIVSAGGTYILEVTDDITNCTAFDTVIVTEVFELPLISINGDSTLTCDRDTAVLNSTGSSNGFPFLQTWYTVEGNILTDINFPEVTLDQPGIYYLSVEDTLNSCEVIDSIVISLDTISPVAVIEDSQVLSLNCNNNFVTLDGSPSGSIDSLMFLWSTIDGNFASGVEGITAQVDSSGVYQLEVTNLRNGCSDDTSYFVGEDFVEPVVAFAEAPTITCDEPTVQIEVLPPGNEDIFEYQWNAPAGSINNDTISNPTVSQSINYTVVVTNIQNGCTNEGSIFVDQNVVLPVAQASAEGTLDCIETMVSISGLGSSVGDYSYLWTTNTGGVIVNTNALETEIDMPGWYVIQVTDDENGCMAFDSVEVVANAIPIIGAQITLDEPDCINRQGTIIIDTVFGGTEPFVFALNNEVFHTFPEFHFLDPDNYEIQIEDASGCTWDTMILMPPPNEPMVDLGLDLDLILGDTATLTALIDFPMNELDTIIWTPLPNPDCPGCLEQGIRPLETTVYSVQVIDIDGCEAKDQVLVLVNESGQLYAPNVFSPNGDGVNDFFYLQSDQTIALIKDFKIFDRWDNMVFHNTDFLPNDANEGWDGFFLGKEMNPQVFVWKAEIEFEDGRMEVVYGDVVLVK